MKKRIYFDKFGEMRFISHLDTLRFMDRLLKKCHIPVKYSQGFHPRPKISLGNPVSLGTAAYNEVMDIVLDIPMTDEELRDKLNSSEVIGFRVNKVETVEDKSSITDIFINALFEVEGEKEDIDKLFDLLNQEAIVERKEKKGKVTERNLKERVIEFSREGNIVKMELVNISPNSFLTLADIKIEDVNIKKLGYKQI
ncbi:radical SAM-linked protein [Cetobacterium ceti]|uniref:Radical SAM-linked protein n=1 Tax=Cetobacterium ceti TaxID=180163 RepID=A0A1T4JXY0_9FUSO|nr:TIGR03936 family radical SAM-associated protein [Cetobacterium ceti]SJZ34988.1 radical SAM-linked protein [Cetobacterium ceti]